MTPAEKRHARLVGALRLLAALAWLALAALVFEAPIREHLAAVPWATSRTVPAPRP